MVAFPLQGDICTSVEEPLEYTFAGPQQAGPFGSFPHPSDSTRWCNSYSHHFLPETQYQFAIYYGLQLLDFNDTWFEFFVSTNDRCETAAPISPALVPVLSSNQHGAITSPDLPTCNGIDACSKSACAYHNLRSISPKVLSVPSGQSLSFLVGF